MVDVRRVVDDAAIFDLDVRDGRVVLDAAILQVDVSVRTVVEVQAVVAVFLPAATLFVVVRDAVLAFPKAVLVRVGAEVVQDAVNRFIAGVGFGNGQFPSHKYVLSTFTLKSCVPKQDCLVRPRYRFNQ